MKVTLIGHATMLVEMNGCTVLTDPVFGDPFEDGAVVACPAREVFLDRMPRPDKVVISHAHLDHFDIPSLDQLPRDVEIFCPNDPIIPYVLGKLGFERISVLEAGASVDLAPQASLLTTFSNIDVIEFGVVFKDDSGVFWNEVDTVVTPGTAEFVRMMVGDVDLLFSVFASQNLGFFESMRAGYPLDIPRANVDNVLRVRPKLVVPGSAGFRFTGELAWTNRFVFPISRERFLDDLRRIDPAQKSTFGNPGDVFELGPAGVRHGPAESTFARMIVDDTELIEFDATAEIPPLVDDDLLCYGAEVLDEEVDRCLTQFSEFLERSVRDGSDPVIAELQRRRHRFGLGVVFPSGRELWLCVRLGPDGVSISRSTDPVHDLSVSHRITASMLVARARYEKSYVYYRGFSRIVETEAGTSDVGSNAVRVNKAIPELLGHFLHARNPHPNHGNERRLDFQLQSYLRKKGAA